MLSINQRGSDWALRIVVTWICRKIYSMLFSFSFFNRESLFPVYNQSNNNPLSTAYAKCAKFMFTNIFPRIHIHESPDARCTLALPKVYSTDYPNGRFAGQKREKKRRRRNRATEREIDGGRGGDGGGSSTSSTWRNEHTRVRTRTPHMRGDFPSGSPRITSSFRK